MRWIKTEWQLQRKYFKDDPIPTSMSWLITLTFICLVGSVLGWIWTGDSFFVKLVGSFGVAEVLWIMLFFMSI